MILVKIKSALPMDDFSQRYIRRAFEHVMIRILTARSIGLIIAPSNAPVAQLDRVPGYELGCREFESLRAHQLSSMLFSCSC